MDSKKAVEHYFKHDRTLIGGRNLYNKLPGKSLAMQNSIARFANTPQNIEKLCFELAKAVGIPDRLRVIYTQNPVVSIKNITVKEAVTQTATLPLTPDAELLAFNPKTTKYPDAKKLVKTLGLKPTSLKKVDVFAALEVARAQAVKKK